MALQKRDIPNALTLLRLALAALTITLLSLWRPPHELPLEQPGVSPEGWAWGIDWLLLVAAVCFITAAVTDALDGYLARKWSAISIFGRIMDPFADKILVLGALIAMASGAFTGLGPDGQPRPALAPLAPLTGFTGWMVTLILARELLVTSIRGVYESRGVDFSATTSGKAKMMLQSGAIPAILIILALSDGDPPRWAAITIAALAWLTTGVTLWSAVPYITKAMRTGTPPVPGGLGTPPVPGGSGVSKPPAPSSHVPPAPDSPLNDPESPLRGSPGPPQSPPTPAPRDGGGTQSPPPGAGP